MSKLVNYKKRSVTLPKGCKNLIDVLQPHQSGKLVSDIYAGISSLTERPTVTRGESVIGNLSEIEKYVAMVFGSRARAVTLMVTYADEHITVNICRMDLGAVRALVIVQAGTQPEEAVRAFFACHNLRIPEYSGMPPEIVPDLPVQIAWDISPRPVEAQPLSALVADLFREGFGFSDVSQLRFRYCEIGDAARTEGANPQS